MNGLEKDYKAVFWDWNGTLLDDLKFCIACINKMLDVRSLEVLDEDSYRQVFGFPVRTYYEKVGFDFEEESWDVVAMEFMNLYWTGMKSCRIFSDVESVLSQIKGHGVSQYVLSAMEQDSLRELIDYHRLSSYFEKVVGISDHYANGKEAMAKYLLESEELNPSDVLMIGDTYHDFEVADQNGMDCILVSRGHQCTQRLLRANVQVLTSLDDVIKYVEKVLLRA